MDPFPALADPVRRELLRALARRPSRVVDLAALHPISRPAVSRHLRVLVDAGLVSVGTTDGNGTTRCGATGWTRSDVLLATCPRARFDESVLDSLDLEVRRTVRDHRQAPTAHPAEETA